jgi:hypothetical protein
MIGPSHGSGPVSVPSGDASGESVTLVLAVGAVEDADAEAAIMAACRCAHAEVVEFTLAPRERCTEDPRDGHDWLVEFAEPPRCPLDVFTRALDEALARANPTYRARRAGDAGMIAPRLVELPAGTFERWRRALAPPGDARVPRVTGDRRLARALLAAAVRNPRVPPRPSLVAAV